MSDPLTRKIGGATVFAIGFGTISYDSLVLAGQATAEQDEERLKILDKVFELGNTFWDTSDFYGDAEEMTGKWFKRTGNRSKIFLGTKFGFTWKPEKMLEGSPEYVKQACESSLRRLGVDYVDLLTAHRLDPTVPVELTVRAMADLVKEGKVKHLGLSDCSANDLRRAHAVHPITAIQVEYSPICLDIEDEKNGLLKTAKELGVKIVCYSPLGRGVLTGQIKSADDFAEGDFRKSFPLFSAENFPIIIKMQEELKEIGERHGSSASQVILAWILAQGEDFLVIPSSSKIKNIEDFMGALKLKLSKEEIEEVRRIAQRANALNGARYPAEWDVSYIETPKMSEGSV